ncbi:MAG: discoidin domain-containing protein [Prevotellaceae bacterium]|jgi:hypothetical protein|nr:discoidin domain-containing protein [Prevotellaceae bacterium]
MKYIIFIAVVLFVSCRQSLRLEQALTLAGDNRAELETVLAHYKENPADSLKYRAAVFLIENMPIHYYMEENRELYFLMDSLNQSSLSDDEVYNKLDSIKNIYPESTIGTHYDITTLTSDFLISHIDKIFSVWQQTSWANKYDFQDFCEYVLPYSVSTEKREFWIDYYREKYKSALSEYTNEITLVDICDRLNDSLIAKYPLQIKNDALPDYSPIMSDNIRFGRCDSYTFRTIYLMRSLGIPVGLDFSPMWMSFLMGHSWNMLLAENGKSYPFMGFDENIQQWVFAKEAPKIYRKTFSVQKECLAVQKINEPIPPLFKQKNIKDVSSEYFQGTDVEINIEKKTSSKIAYLCVYNNLEWIPVHWSKIRNNRVLFDKMRNSFAYLPAYYTGKIVAAANPIILDSLGNMHPIKPDYSEKQTLILDRKFPLRRIISYVNRMLDGRFEAANRVDFSDAEELYTIKESPKLIPNIIDLKSDKTYRYIRYFGAVESHCNVAEIAIYTVQNAVYHKLSGKIIGTEGSNGDGRQKKAAFDGDPLSFFDHLADSNIWLGLDFGKPQRIDRISYIPRNDDNNIRPGDLYELFFWDNGQWNSLGQKTGDDSYVLVYENCPSGALFLLHNHTRGREERPFTYENGRQVWW